MTATQIINLIVFIVLGLVGAYAHWFKKFYVDKTTKDTLSMYIFSDPHSTLYAISSIAFSEMGLSVVNPSLTMTAVIAGLTTGYMFDSGINKASDAS
jgi:hypothetical protein